MNTEEFIRLSREKHGDKYDYSHVVYVKAKDKVKIICPIHGEFEQCAFSHYKCGSGCSKCSSIERGSNSKKWTYESCYTEAKKYKSRSEFKKGCASAYSASCKNGWLKYYTWFEEKQKPKGYWTYERCYEEAKKYKTKREFAKGSPSAYNVSYKKGWLDNYIWFIKRQKPNGYWNSYENCLDEAKKYKSRSEFKKSCNGAYRSSIKHNWINDYTWFKSLLKPKGYWTYETCFEEAKKYKTRKKFENGCSGAYNVSRKNGWLNDYTWFIQRQKPPYYWTLERSIEEAKKYKTRSEFIKGSSGAYKTLKNNNLLDIFFINKRDSKAKIHCVYQYYFKETNAIYIGRTLTERLKERDYEHKFKNRSTIYYYIKNNKVKVPDIDLLYDNLTCKESLKIEDDIVRIRRDEGYVVLNKAKTGINSGSIGRLFCGKWTYKTCLDEAKKYKSRKEFEKFCNGGYQVSYRKGWINDYTWFIQKHKPNGYWTYDRCYEEAKKYKSRGEFSEKCGFSYKVASRNKWLDDYTWFIQRQKPNGYWTLERSIEEAKKYKSRSEFKKWKCCAYHVIRKNNLLDTYFPK